MIAPKVVIETSEICPVVIDVVIPSSTGMVYNPHKIETSWACSGGTKVTSSTVG